MIYSLKNELKLENENNLLSVSDLKNLDIEKFPSIEIQEEKLEKIKKQRESLGSVNLRADEETKKYKDEINEILSLSLSKTKDMKAQVGRAKFLENRGLGCIDPGARSTEIILREFFDSVL